MTMQVTAGTAAVVVGLGKTGLSAVRYLRTRGARVAVTDSRSSPPELAALRAFDASVPVSLGGFDETLLAGSNLVVASPGVATSGPFFSAAQRQGLPVVGDLRYGAPQPLPDRSIALLARRLEVEHPTSGERLVLVAPDPPGWPWRPDESNIRNDLGM